MEGRQKTDNGGQVDSAEFYHLASDPCHRSTIRIGLQSSIKRKRPENRLTVLRSVLCFLTSVICLLISVDLFDIQLLPGVNRAARIQLV